LEEGIYRVVGLQFLSLNRTHQVPGSSVQLKRPNGSFVALNQPKVKGYESEGREFESLRAHPMKPFPILTCTPPIPRPSASLVFGHRRQ
jgi:hypothetical protein